MTDLRYDLPDRSIEFELNYNIVSQKLTVKADFSNDNLTFTKSVHPRLIAETAAFVCSERHLEDFIDRDHIDIGIFVVDNCYVHLSVILLTEDEILYLKLSGSAVLLLSTVKIVTN